MQRPAAALYKKLLDHIHPQLPLSVRESNRLLAVLKGTFHKQLDLEHPFADSVAPSSSSPRFAEASSHELPTSHQANVSSHISASQHLDTVLSHPLLGGSSAKPQRRSSGESSSSSTSNRFEAYLDACLQARRKFQSNSDKHVATVESAMELLSIVQHYASMINSPKHAREFIKQTQITQTLLQFLRGRHMLTSSAIRKNPSLFEALVKCLVADGRHVIVEKWLLNSRIPAPEHEQARGVDLYTRRWLLDVLLRAETQQFGLQTSVMRFSRRVELLETLCKENTLTADEEIDIAQPALTALTQSLTDSRNGTPVSREVYDKLISSLGSPVSDSPYLVHVARLKLYHPTKPDASSMLDLLQTLDPVPAPAGDDWTAQLKTLVQWAVDASKLLSRQGNSEPADRALQFAKRMCAAAKVDWDELLRSREVQRFEFPQPLEKSL